MYHDRQAERVNLATPLSRTGIKTLASACSRTFAVTELLEQILCNLFVNDLYVVQRVDHNFKKVIEASLVLQEKMHLTCDSSGSYAAARRFSMQGERFPPFEILTFTEDDKGCTFRVYGAFLRHNFTGGGVLPSPMKFGWQGHTKIHDFPGSWSKIKVLEDNRILQLRGLIAIRGIQKPLQTYEFGSVVDGNTVGAVLEELAKIRRRSLRQHLVECANGRIAVKED